jgi:hypothetical protein
MQTYADLVELARICLKQAREANNPIVSAEFSFCIAVMAPCEEMLPPKWKSLVRNFFVPVPSTGNLSGVMAGLTESYLPTAIMSGRDLPKSTAMVRAAMVSVSVFMKSSDAEVEPREGATNSNRGLD